MRTEVGGGDDVGLARRVVMSWALAMGPTGRLRLEDDAAADGAELPDGLLRELRSALSVSNGAGFVVLVSST